MTGEPRVAALDWMGYPVGHQPGSRWGSTTPIPGAAHEIGCEIGHLDGPSRWPHPDGVIQIGYPDGGIQMGAWAISDGAIQMALTDTVGPPARHISHSEITTSLPEIVISPDVVPLGRRVRCASRAFSFLRPRGYRWPYPDG